MTNKKAERQAIRADVRQAAEADLIARLGVRSVPAPASSAVETTDRGGESLTPAPTLSMEK